MFLGSSNNVPEGLKENTIKTKSWQIEQEAACSEKLSQGQLGCLAGTRSNLSKVINLLASRSYVATCWCIGIKKC